MSEHIKEALQNTVQNPPGTVLLVHLGQNNKDDSTVKIPMPANTVNDPLNWSKAKKLWHYAILSLWAFLANACIVWSAPVWGVWTVALNTNYTMLTYGQALLVLMCGVGILFIQPWATKYGRRLPFLLGSLLILIGLVFARMMTDIKLFLAYMVVAGFGSAPAYATINVAFLDVTFLHKRGNAISIFVLILVAGNFLPPLAAGYIVDAQGWEWCVQYLLIFFGAVTLLFLFTADESSFARNEFKARNPARHDTELTQIQENRQTFHHDIEKAHDHLPETEAPTPDNQPLSYLKRMTLFRKNHDVKIGYWRLAFSMFELTVLPAPTWMSIQFGLSSFVVSLILTTLATFFSESPYNFSPSTLGLMPLALLIGAGIGSLWGGLFTDWLLLRLSKGQGGIYEPEHRLWTYLLMPVAGAGGVLLYGLGADNGLHWIVPALGLILVGFYLDGSTPIAMGYALDSYPDLEDEVVQLSNFLRNIIGGATTFGIQPWLEHNGRRDTIIIIAVLVFVINSSSIGFQIWGKRFRTKTAERYYVLRDRSMSGRV
ncbi:hypothetical protein AJ78_04370 [Emergomyces pasteurianus Ep9510]|uniref:Major facilitator superfamily (MFS) profile domain-containing protein n=1 Tax=Emergomyces pasteurianus Ep9510 TaxID=1447872 RepID=A0A1J9QJH9_9EURO|nr:hypothetical protein AJ78_04370 [Emergomyces pasteurianus Ep9510]